MLHLALAALLATSFGLGDITPPDDGEKEKVFRTQATVGLAPADEAPISTTYGFGQPEPTFLNAWAGFAWGRSENFYDAAGNQQNWPTRTVQRAFLGAEANLFPLGGMTFSVGGELMLGSVSVEGQPSVGFGLHTLKLFGQLRGRALGAHAGYVLDLADEPAAPGEPRLTHGHDAFLVGFSYDHQPAWLRTFGGLDIYRLLGVTGHDGTGWDAPALLVFTAGLGAEFGIVQVGVASIWRAHLVRTAVDTSIPGSSHQHSFAPYLHLSPTFLPVGIGIRGAVPVEFADYGFSTMGSLDGVTQLGFTVALTWGF